MPMRRTVEGHRGTADWLNRQGYRTKFGSPFATSSVKEIIANPFFGPAEVIRYHGGEAETPMPPEHQIFSPEIHKLWTRAQERRVSRGQSGRCISQRVYPLHPVIRCIHCNSVYHGQIDRHGERGTVHVNRGTDCPHPLRFNSGVLESQLMECLEQVEVPRNWRAQIQRLTAAPTVDDNESERHRLEGG